MEKYLSVLISINLLFLSCKGNKREETPVLTEPTASVQKESKKVVLKDIDYLPDNFFELVTPATPLEKIKEMFGIADKFYNNKEEGYTYYYYDLKNALLA